MSSPTNEIARDTVSIADVGSASYCKTCGSPKTGRSISSSGQRAKTYCKTCHAKRSEAYRKRKKRNGGHHTETEWHMKLAATPACPGCLRPWSEIPRRSNPRYRHTWTKDHVVPVAHGGRKDWENIVTCCITCNRRKGGRTPEQAGMRLVRLPRRPDKAPALRITIGLRDAPESWRDYLYWNVELDDGE